MKLLNFDLILNLVKKDIQVRYMGSSLGFIWSLGNPLITTVMYYLVFTTIFPNPDSRFALYLITGVLHWSLVVQFLPQSCEWLTNNSNLLRKISFPRIFIPLSSIFTIMIFWSSALLVYLILFKFLGGTVSIAIILYPFVLASFIAFLVGCSLIFSVLYVNMRDLKYLIDVIMPILFWCTPIVWKMENLSASLVFWLNLNPLTLYFNIFSNILYGAHHPRFIDFIIAISMGLGMLLLGWFIFKKLSKNIVESL